MRMFLSNRLFFYLIFAIAFFSCEDSESDKMSGHDQMIAILDSIYQNQDVRTDLYSNQKRLNYFKSQAPDQSIGRRINQKAVIASEMLNSGLSEDAASLFTEVLTDLESNNISNSEYKGTIQSMLAIAWLRVAEQDNCLKNHSAESCIFPLKNQAIHHIPKGAENAIKIYTDLLNANPEDYESKWLLNLSYMILGKYPEGVPAKYRIAESVFNEEARIASFVNVAESVGLDHVALSGGSIMEDFNGDSYLDIMCTSWGIKDQVKVFLNDKTGGFVDFTSESGIVGISGGLNAKAGDFNNDGIIDVFITRGGWRDESGNLPNSLLKGIGDGSFVDVTIESGLLSLRPTQTMTWNDFNNDGWLDIFIGNESRGGISNPCEFYLNKGDGTFDEVSDILKVRSIGFVKGVVSDDFDNDGRMDLFLSINQGANRLLRNRRSNNSLGFVFDDISRKAGIAEPINSFPTWSFDYDHDGDQDIFVATYDMKDGDNLKELLGLPTNSDRCKLYSNNGDATFTDITEELGMDIVTLAMGSNFGDLNNDGWLDMYIGTGHPDFRFLIPNRAFINQEGKKFTEVTNSSGLGHLQKGHAVSFGDVDRDGDNDVYSVMGGAFEGDVFQNAFFINPGEQEDYISLKLEGSQSNKLAIGARVVLHLTSGRKIYRTVGSGGSFGSSPFELTINIDSDIDKLEVDWPLSEKAMFYTIEKNNKYLIIEQDSIPKLMNYDKIDFKI